MSCLIQIRLIIVLFFYCTLTGELYVYKQQSFPLKRSPKIHFMFGGRLVFEEFQQPRIQTKIVQHFGGFFHHIKVCQRIVLYLAAQNSFKKFKIKIKKLKPIVVDVLSKAYQ
jgi:hypothetical protein